MLKAVAQYDRGRIARTLGAAMVVVGIATYPMGGLAVAIPGGVLLVSTTVHLWPAPLVMAVRVLRHRHDDLRLAHHLDRRRIPRHPCCHPAVRVGGQAEVGPDGGGHVRIALDRILVALVLPLSAAAALAVALPCAYQSESASVSLPGGLPTIERSCQSLLDYSLDAVLFFVGPPIVLAVVGVVASLLRLRLASVLSGALIIAGGVVLTVFSFAFFPLYFVPAGTCLIVAAATTSRAR